VAVTLHNLSSIYRQRGDLDAAEQSKQALTIKRDILGEEHPEIAGLVAR